MNDDIFFRFRAELTPIWLLMPRIIRVKEGESYKYIYGKDFICYSSMVNEIAHLSLLPFPGHAILLVRTLL